MFKNKYTFLFAIVLTALQIWFFYLMFRYPVQGILVHQDNEKNWVIERFDTTSLVNRTDLKVGDIIATIDGMPADEFHTVRRWNAIEQSNSVTVLRGGIEYNVDMSAKNPLASNDILALLAETCSFIIAFMLSKKITNSKSALYLSAVFLVIGLIFMSLGASLRGDILGKGLILCFMLMLPSVFYQFIAVFLSEKGFIEMPKNFLKWIYPVTFGVLVLHICLFYSYTTAIYFYRLTGVITLSITVLGMAANVVLIVHTYLKYRIEKTYLSLILKTITISLFISLAPIMFLSFIPQIIFGKNWIDPFYMSWFIFVLPLSFAYLIVSKKLYDLDMIMRRFMFTGLIALWPSILFTVMIRLMFPTDATSERLTIVFLLFSIAFTVILYSLENITTKLEPIIFPRKYRLKDALKKISKNLEKISNLREMKDIILVDIVNTLEVNGGAIVYRYQDHVEYISEGSLELTNIQHILESEPNYNDSPYTLIEISKHEEYTSYLIIADRKNRSRINSDEIQWLNLIITYLAVSLENIHLIRKLTVKLEQFASQLPDEKSALDIAWFRKLMFELQEKERIRIATDLHDTTMQDLFFLKNRLRTLLEKYPFYQDDRSSIESLMEYIDIINTNLRQSCFELHPYLLQEIGIVQTIRKLIDLESITNPFEIQFHVKGTYLLEQADNDTKRHIFRLVQELINNAKKHSQANLLQFQINADAYGITFSYEDDGVGFDPNTVTPSEIGGAGIGMEQMKSRIISMNGKYALETSVGQGLKFSASLPVIPVKEGHSA